MQEETKSKEELQRLLGIIREPKDKFVPFHRGTEAMQWRAQNCDLCNNSACTRAGELLDIEVAEKMFLKGEECFGVLALDYAEALHGHMDVEAKEFIWGKDGKNGRMLTNCKEFKPLKT